MKKKLLICLSGLLVVMGPISLRAETKLEPRVESKIELEKGHVVCEIVEKAFQSARGNDKGASGLHALDFGLCEKVLMAGQENSSKRLVNALKGYLSVGESERDRYLEELVSSLGRQLKNSVDNPTHHLKDNDCLIHKSDLEGLVGEMEQVLGKKDLSEQEYHKLMIESLAEKKYDMALYAYVNIAKARCN